MWPCLAPRVRTLARTAADVLELRLRVLVDTVEGAVAVRGGLDRVGGAELALILGLEHDGGRRGLGWLAASGRGCLVQTAVAAAGDVRGNCTARAEWGWGESGATVTRAGTGPFDASGAVRGRATGEGRRVSARRSRTVRCTKALPANCRAGEIRVA